MLPFPLSLCELILGLSQTCLQEGLLLIKPLLINIKLFSNFICLRVYTRVHIRFSVLGLSFSEWQKYDR